MLSLGFLPGGICHAQSIAPAQSNATDPNYILINGDTLSLQVLEESDLAASLLIDKDGQIRAPLLGDIVVNGQTVRAAEKMLEEAYVGKELLKKPQVRLNVTSYAPRLVTVYGAVRNPGKVGFGRDFNTIDIVDAITQAGGFSGVARKDQVNVIRTDLKGKEQTFVVDVEAMMSSKRPADKPREFALQPGDRIIVRERVF